MEVDLSHGTHAHPAQPKLKPICFLHLKRIRFKEQKQKIRTQSKIEKEANIKDQGQVHYNIAFVGVVKPKEGLRTCASMEEPMGPY